MSKPLEFWIGHIYEGVLGAYYSKEEAVEESWMQSEDNVDHVIEKSAYDTLIETLRKVHALWREHERTKFLSDGSHFQVDKEIRDLMGEIKHIIDPDSGSSVCKHMNTNPLTCPECRGDN